MDEAADVADVDAEALGDLADGDEVSVGARRGGMVMAMVNVMGYGWGMVPVAAKIGSTMWTTSLFPKDGLYFIPLKAAVRRAASVELGDEVTVSLPVDL